LKNGSWLLGNKTLVAQKVKWTLRLFSIWSFVVFFIISINTIFLILQVWLTKICSDPGNHVYLYMCTDMYTVDKILFSVVGYISLLASTHYVRFTLYPLYQFLILNSCSYKYMTYVERCLRPTPVICYLPVKYTCISVR